MWKNFDGKPYDRDQLAARIRSLDFSKWRMKDGSTGRPRFITLHNTSEPTLKQYIGWSPQKRRQYIHNVQEYYENDKGWRGGPHWFVPPTLDDDDPHVAAFGFNDPVASGTHCSCDNDYGIGIEMFGEFNNEAFDSGPGASVRDNAVYLMALLHAQARLSPDTLHFHIECHRDNHDCPGTNARNKPDLIARVKAEMARLALPGGSTEPPPIQPPVEPPVTPADPGAVVHDNVYMTEFGGRHDPNDSAYTGKRLDGSKVFFSLPANVPPEMRQVEVKYRDKTIVGPIEDKGPHNTHDNDYVFGAARPLAESQYRHKTSAQNGRIPGNPAGLDASPAAMTALGVKGPEDTRSVGRYTGSGVVEGVSWRFVKK